MDPQISPNNNLFVQSQPETLANEVDVPQVVDENDQPVVKDIFWAKRANMVAMVAGMGVLAGLLATTILTTRKQDLRQKAYDSVDLGAISRCVGQEAVVDVSVISPRMELSGEIKDLQTNTSVLLGRVTKGDRVKAVIHTKKAKLESAAVELSLRFEDERVYKLASTYEAVKCE